MMSWQLREKLRGIPRLSFLHHKMGTVITPHRAVVSTNEAVPVSCPERCLTCCRDSGMEAIINVTVLLPSWLEAVVLGNHLPCM